MNTMSEMEGNDEMEDTSTYKDIIPQTSQSTAKGKKCEI